MIVSDLFYVLHDTLAARSLANCHQFANDDRNMKWIQSASYSINMHQHFGRWVFFNQWLGKHKSTAPGPSSFNHTAAAAAFRCADHTLS